MRLKTGISYCLFDGVELLEKNISNIRPFVDYINVVYSDYSYLGYPNIENDFTISELNRLKNIGLIDKILYFTGCTNDHSKVSELETAKRNIGLFDCVNNDVEYYMSIDVDEFYVSEQFKRAVEHIKIKRYSHTYVPILDYSEKNKISLNYNYTFYVPFLSLVTKKSIHTNKHSAPCLIDITRGLSDTENMKQFCLNGLFMHHFRTVRNDLQFKYLTRYGQNFYPVSNENEIEVKNLFNL